MATSLANESPEEAGAISGFLGGLTILPVASSGAPLRDAAGAERGVVLVFRDDSERREAHHNAQHAEENL
jgi:PAS domain-containing protein